MLSFVIPTYEPDLVLFKKCLESLKKQSLKEWEVVVVLDGPCPAAEGVVDVVADKRIRVVELPHGGVQRARNHGFTLTSGEVVSFWDCDCIIEPDTAKMWMETFKERPELAFIYSGYRFLNEQGGIPSEPFDPWTLRVANYISTMFPLRREAFPGFDESLKSLQDWDMWLSVVEKGGKGLFVPGYAFATAFPTPKSISGQGCTNAAWLERVAAVKAKHGIPDRKVCVTSVIHREEGIRLAKLIDADYKDHPNHKPHGYTTMIQVGFSLHPERVRRHSEHFASKQLTKKVIYWTLEDVTEVNNAISLKALDLYAGVLNATTKQYVEDMAAKKVMDRAGFNVSIQPVPMVNADAIEALPAEARVLVDITEEYRQVMACVERSLPDIKFDFLGEDKPVKDYSAMLYLNPEKTLSFGVKRMLLAGRNVISNVEAPFCGFVDDTTDSGRYIEDLVTTIRKRVARPAGPAVDYWSNACTKDALLEVLK
jgi:hypothetical protein